MSGPCMNTCVSPRFFAISTASRRAMIGLLPRVMAGLRMFRPGFFSPAGVLQLNGFCCSSG